MPNTARKVAQVFSPVTTTFQLGNFPVKYFFARLTLATDGKNVPRFREFHENGPFYFSFRGNYLWFVLDDPFWNKEPLQQCGSQLTVLSLYCMIKRQWIQSSEASLLLFYVSQKLFRIVFSWHAQYCSTWHCQFPDLSIFQRTVFRTATSDISTDWQKVTTMHA